MSDLTTPLGIEPPKSRRGRLPYGLIAASLAGAATLVVGLWLAFVDDPLGGEPVVVVSLRQAQETSERRDVAMVGVASRPDDSGIAPASFGAPAAGIGPGYGQTQSPASVSNVRAMPTQALPDLAEPGPHGMLPRTGSDGLRPLEAYARPVPSHVGAAPKVAIMVGGLGLSQSGTQEAIRRLPGEVTLGFAPYGSSLDRWAARARQDGHEIVLQVPQEPFDFPDNDPGPHTLLTTEGAGENLDRLHWTMARLEAYVGIVNYMGARFSADGDAMAPIMEEVAGRGLLYLDDGGSPRSRARETAAATGVPFVRADLVIDAEASAQAIDERLAQLESIARGRGLAVGVASALPMSVSRIAEWAGRLEARGITLVPITAALPRESS